MPRGIPNSRPDVAEQASALSAAEAAPSPRAAEERRERRRRDDGDLDRGARMKLAIPREIRERAERDGKTLRWVNDTGNRMHDLTVDDDWDKVPGAPTVPVGTSVDGQPIKAHLCWKDKDWYQQDQKGKSAHLDDMERAVERGAKASSEDTLDDDVRYAAAGNRISRGR